MGITQMYFINKIFNLFKLKNAVVAYMDFEKAFNRVYLLSSNKIVKARLFW